MEQQPIFLAVEQDLGIEFVSLVSPRVRLRRARRRGAPKDRRAEGGRPGLTLWKSVAPDHPAAAH